MDNSKILIVSVLYNSYDSCQKFVLSISPFLSDRINLIIVDNSEIQDVSFLAWLKQQNQKISYIMSGKNLGYFGGVRFGLEQMAFNKKNYDWIIISNVDVVITQPDFFSKLADFVKNKDIGILAPIIYSKTHNQNLNPKYRNKPTKKKISLLKMVFSNVFLLNIYVLLASMYKFIAKPKIEVINSSDSLLEKIYAPHGSFLILHKNYFNSNATLNNPSFLFGEEIFLAEECISNQLSVYYTEDIHVEDYPHTSTGILRGRKMAKLMYQSVCDIEKKILLI